MLKTSQAIYTRSTSTRQIKTQLRHSSATDLLREQIYQFILRTGNAGVTDEEIALAFELSGNVERPRRNELVTMQRVAASGIRRATLSGRTATVWKSTRVMETLNKKKPVRKLARSR